jgi:hypothetical protein
VAKSPSGQYTSWARKLRDYAELRDKAKLLRGTLIDDESGQAVALDDMLAELEKLRKMLGRERAHPGKRRKIEHELADVVDAMKPLLDKLRRKSRGRLPQARELAQEIMDILERLP